MTTVRKGHPNSRPLPASSLPVPPHIRRLTATAMLGTLDAPIGATLPAIYLAAARALIREAVNVDRKLRECANDDAARERWIDHWHPRNDAGQ